MTLQHERHDDAEQHDIDEYEDLIDLSKRININDNKKYLSTDLSKPIDSNEKYISNKIKLLQYEVI